MTDFVDDEARGDHSNFKGSHYHLVYALWRLVKYPSQHVGFYQGNDLTVTLTVPPISIDADESDSGDSGDSVYSTIKSRDCDIWCQLKNTQDPWTVSEVLKGNLLFNFIGNSFVSTSRNRCWEIELISTAEFRSKDLRNFAADFANSKGGMEGPNAKRLNEIVDKATVAIAESICGIAATRDDVTRRAIKIIELLSIKEPFQSRALQAEFRCGLLTATGDAALATKIEHRLIGALLTDASAGPESARWYNGDWFRQVTGFDPNSQKPFDLSVRHACNSQVESQTPISYRESLFAARAEVHEALTEFLSSSKTCFLVTGRSGTGKTWSLFHWARHSRNDRARLFLDGQRHRIGQNLSSMLAIELRPLTSQTSVSDESLSERIFTAAQFPEFGPLVLIIDDIQPTADRIETFRVDLNRLVLDCKARGIKLVVSCQTERVSGLHPFSLIRSDLLFHPGEKPHRVDHIERGEQFEITEFVDNELEDAISRRLPDEPSERDSLRLKAPAFHYIRNPYILDLLFRSGRDVVTLHSVVKAEECVDELFQRRIRELVERVSIDCVLDQVSAQEGFDAMLQSLWSQRHRTLRRAELQRHIDKVVPGSGDHIVDFMVRRSVIVLGQSLTFAEPQFAARAVALWLTCHKSVVNVIGELTLDTDTEVLTQWLRLQEFPARIAASIVSRSEKWRPAVAHALSRCRIDDLTVIASLIGLARDHSDSREDRKVCDALGEYAMRSRVAWKWIVRLFLSHDDGDRTIGERSLSYLARFVPERVARAIRLRVVRHGLQRLKGEKDRKHRRKIARAIRPLRNIDSRFAGNVVLKTLASLENFSSPASIEQLNDETFAKFLTDPLVEEFDELQAVAAYYADFSLFTHICDGLRSGDNVRRLRSTNGIAALGREASKVVGPMLAEAILNENVARIAARMIWHLVGFAETNPQTAFHAVENCPANDWTDYELSGTVLSLFEFIGRKFPKASQPIFPRILLPQDDEARFWLIETFLVSLQPFLSNYPSTKHLRAGLVDSLVTDDREEPVFIFLRSRALAVAQLLDVARQEGITDTPDIERVELQGELGCFFNLNLDSWIHHYISEWDDPLCLNEIVENLIKSIAASNKCHPDNDDKWRTNAAFMMTRDSIDVLVLFLSQLPERIELLKQLPHNWEMLYAIRRTLKLGNHSPEIVELALSECANHKNSATPQAVFERSECLIELRKIDPSLVPEIQSEQTGLSWFFGGGQSASDQLSAAIDSQAHEMLEILDSTIHKPSDAIMTLDWTHKAKRWESVALSWVFARCADAKPLSRREAIDLIVAMRSVLEVLPDSELCQSWRATYRGIQRNYEGKAIDYELPSTNETPIQRSHALVAKMLDSSSCAEFIESKFVTDRRGWWETEQFKRAPDGAIQPGWGTGYYLSGFFPAVRLALAVCSSTLEWNDPGAKWMNHRTQAVLLIKELQWSSCSAAEKIQQLQDAIRKMPQQESLHLTLGNLLVKDGQYDSGFAALSTVLSMPNADNNTRASAYYDLACIHARRGDGIACESALTESARLNKLDKKWLAEDADFESVRNADWFAKFRV